MQKEILSIYEKIKDQLSEEEFLAEIEDIRENFDDIGFMNDIDFARMVLKNHGIIEDEISQDSEDESSEESDLDAAENIEETTLEVEENNDDASGNEITEMSDEVLEIYKDVENEVSKEDFIKRMNEFRKENSGIGFYDDVAFANMVKGEFITEENEPVSKDLEFNIEDLEEGKQDISISGRLMSISNPKSFTTRKNSKGQVCNVELADNTGSIRVVFWTPNIKLLKNVTEGDIVQINGVDIKKGFRDQLEANMRPRATMIHLKDVDESNYPAYEEDITDIADIKPNETVNIIARIVRIPTTRTYEKNGKKGKVASIELQDKTGKISYTLWNKSVDLIKELGLNDGDTVKILSAQSREGRDNEITLSHWDGRIIKGDFEVPEIEQNFSKIGGLQEERDVSIIGVVSKLQDVRTFNRKSDNSEGKLRNFDVMDDTGSIRVTVWGDDTKISINKGNIIKIIGGDVRFDDYTATGYSMNTNFNTQITVSPNNLSDEELDYFDKLREQLKPTPVGQVQELQKTDLK